MRQLGKFLWVGGVVALFASSSAWAQGEIRGLRLGGDAQYDRIVFDLGQSSIDASASESDPFVIELRASPPPVDLKTDDKLGKIGVRIERVGDGTRISIDKRGRGVRAFRLPAANAGAGARLVLDVAKKSGYALEVPSGAERLASRAIGGGGGGSGSTSPGLPQVAVNEPSTPPTPSGNVEPPGLPEVRGVTPSVSASPSTPGTGAGEEVWVSVRAIDFEGVKGEAPSRDDLLNLDLNVSELANGDLVDERKDLPVRSVTLRALTSDQKGRIGGSVLQKIVERIADEYEERGKYGTRIDISKRDLERLLKDQDGRLVIRISEPSEAGSNG